MDYRHELKFLVPETDLERLRGRLDQLMPLDQHQDGDFYTIRSLYFDDLFDSCLEDVLSGTDRRHKFRIRTYNAKTDVIHLEKKSKYRGMIRKVSEDLTIDSCRDYLEGLPVPAQGLVSLELLQGILSTGMSPRCIVEYDRTAYVEPAGNVRITFDRNIRGTMKTDRFLEPDSEDYVHVLPAGMHILEVKYDEFLPDYLLQVVDLNSLQRTSFSKYAYVRNCTDIREATL